MPRQGKAAGRRSIALVVLGEPITQRWRHTAAKVARDIYHLRPVWLPRQPLPKMAWHPKFRRFRAEQLCRALAAKKPREASLILGLVSVDISTKQPGFRDHAVFGLADVGGPAAVLSIHKLQHRQGKTLYTRSQQHALWRGLLIHEIGHLHRLPHCPTPRCPMFDAGASSPALLGMRAGLCTRCQERLAH